MLLEWFPRTERGSDRWPFFLFSTYCWSFSLQSCAGWDKEANQVAWRLLSSIGMLKVGAPGRRARAGPNSEGKTKILCICCVCCCGCRGRVGIEASVTVTGGKAHLSHSSRALVELYPKYLVPGHTESLNQVNQALAVRRGKGWYPRLTQPCKWEGASGLVSVKLSKTLLVAALLLTAFRRVLLC